jgi:hypothetical protein
LRVFTFPVVSTIPEGIPILVDAPFVKVPYAADGHVIVALLTVSPPPIIAFTTAVAVPPWLAIINCANEKEENDKI